MIEEDGMGFRVRWSVHVIGGLAANQRPWGWTSLLCRSLFLLIDLDYRKCIFGMRGTRFQHGIDLHLLLPSSFTLVTGRE